MVLSAFPLSRSTTVSSLLDQIANELTQDQNLVRIKKLLFYVCSGTWETNMQQLNNISLRDLLQHLFDRSVSFEQLQSQLNQVVATLNKSAEYTIVANAIISRFSAVYMELQQGQTTTASQAFYQTIAQQLEQEPRRNRIKKLLLLTCRSRWESSISRLDHIQFVDLIRELHQLAPSIESLRTTLQQVARALSKPEEYTEVATKIADICRSLYLDQDEEGLTELREPVELTCPKALPIEEPTAVEEKPDNSITKFNEAKLADAQPPIADPEVVQKPARRVQPVGKTYKVSDLFNLRWEIMQDTNPFKAKILLFSLLHEPFTWEADHDAILKSHELDDLLRILFVTYRFYSEVDQKLRLLAKKLDAREYQPVAEAILRAIQPFYIKAPVAATIAPVVSAASLTEITSMKAETCEITQPEQHSALQETVKHSYETTVEY